MASDKPATTKRRPTVTLVEDEPAVRRSLQLLLHGRGYEVRAYGSGPALLADPGAKNAACLVADYRMPELDGLEVLEQLRARGWDGPAMLVTAFNSDELSARAAQAGFNKVIEKPFLDHVLVDAVGELVSE